MCLLTRSISARSFSHARPPLLASSSCRLSPLPLSLSLSSCLRAVRTCTPPPSLTSIFRFFPAPFVSILFISYCMFRSNFPTPRGLLYLPLPFLLTLPVVIFGHLGHLGSFSFVLPFLHSFTRSCIRRALKKKSASCGVFRRHLSLLSLSRLSLSLSWISCVRSLGCLVAQTVPTLLHFIYYLPTYSLHGFSLFSLCFISPFLRDTHIVHTYSTRLDLFLSESST